MMELNLNILSPTKKKKLSGIVNFIFIKNLLEIATFTTALMAIVLLWSWMTLIDSYKNLSESAILVNKEYGSYNQEIRAINKTLHEAGVAAQGYIPNLNPVLEIINIIPPDIIINAMEIDRETQTLIISGTAKTRDALLNFSDVIKKITWLEQTAAPTSQLFQKENINFEMKAKLKGFPILKKAVAPKIAPKVTNDITE